MTELAILSTLVAGMARIAIAWSNLLLPSPPPLCERSEDTNERDRRGKNRALSSQGEEDSTLGCQFKGERISLGVVEEPPGPAVRLLLLLASDHE
jgi:hypothetical protein